MLLPERRSQRTAATPDLVLSLILQQQLPGARSFPLMNKPPMTLKRGGHHPGNRELAAQTLSSLVFILLQKLPVAARPIRPSHSSFKWKKE